jgi:TonB family protein
MGYQALLFCPDEKTARTVTQVLNELDFTVVPCTEPFAAVKKLMGERFDAVVVDCDNEQNATLLFKSARNTANNQSSLAVAVVEGQAGVAKAFRIGANLVLTKPINVEQAKGTLRVARGLLRKSEAARPATPAATGTAKPATSGPAPAKPVPAISSAAASRPTLPIAPLMASATASLPAQVLQPGELESEITSRKPEVLATPPSVGFSPRFASGAASAPAPAREQEPSASTEDKSSAVLSEPESAVEKVAASGISSSLEETFAPAPAFPFGESVSSDTESAGGGSKKALLAVAAVVLIAAGGYGAWTQWGRSNGTSSVPTSVGAQRAVTRATVPQGAPSSAALASSSSSDAQTIAGAENAQAHPSKVIAGADLSKPPASALAANKGPAAKPDAQTIVIENHLSQPAGKSAATTDAPALNMNGIAAADSSGAIPNLLGQSKAATPVLQRLNVSQGVSQGLVMKKVQPTYPASAMRMRVEGAVQLMATISKNGDISAVKILSGDGQLARAAADAVKRWKYKPYLLNGEPVEIQTQVTVNFKLPR